MTTVWPLLVEHAGTGICVLRLRWVVGTVGLGSDSGLVTVYGIFSSSPKKICCLTGGSSVLSKWLRVLLNVFPCYIVT